MSNFNGTGNNNGGLKRNLHPINVLSLALGSIIGWGAFIMPGTVFLPKGGPIGTVLGMGVAAVVMIIIALNYGYMINKYPVAGGEYTFVAETLGRRHAYVCGWFLGLAYLAIVPLNATALALVARKLFGELFQFGYLYTIAGWDIFIGEILMAIVALSLFAFFSIKGIGAAAWLQTIITFALIGSVLAMLIMAFGSEAASISHLTPSFPEDTSPINAILAILVVSPFAYLGFDSIPQTTEEFNFSPKKATSLMVISILIATVIYVTLVIITALVMPWESLLAANYDWAVSEAVDVLLGDVGVLLLGIGVFCAILSGIIGFYTATSRLFYSMGKGGELPAWFAKIDEKGKTPKNAIIFILIVSVIAPWFGREVLVWIVDMTSISAAVGFGYTSFATYLTLRKDKEGSRPLLYATSILGTILSGILVLLLLVPSSPTYLGIESRVALLAWIFMGFVFYFFRKNRNSK